MKDAMPGDRDEDRKTVSSSETFLRFRPAAGLFVLAAAALVFVLIAADVTNAGRGTVVDARFSIWLHTHRAPVLMAFFRLISRVHANLGVSLVTVGLCAYLWAKHLRDWVLTFLLAVFGGMLLNVALKFVFVRARPSFPDAMPQLTTFSFPSGHTMLASVFYGSLCAFFFSRTRSGKLRALVILSSVLMIALVGFSRMYLGAHYLTDVLGGMAEGLAWLAVCFLIVSTRRRRRGRRRQPA